MMGNLRLFVVYWVSELITRISSRCACRENKLHKRKTPALNKNGWGKPTIDME